MRRITVERMAAESRLSRDEVDEKHRLTVELGYIKKKDLDQATQEDGKESVFIAYLGRGKNGNARNCTEHSLDFDPDQEGHDIAVIAQEVREMFEVFAPDEIAFIPTQPTPYVSVFLNLANVHDERREHVKPMPLEKIRKVAWKVKEIIEKTLPKSVVARVTSG